MAIFVWEDKASRWCEFNDGPLFSDIPALKLGRCFTGIAAKTTGAIFPVKRRQRHQRRHFSGKTQLTLLFFRLNAVNAAFFPVQRR